MTALLVWTAIELVTLALTHDAVSACLAVWFGLDAVCLAIVLLLIRYDSYTQETREI